MDFSRDCHNSPCAMKQNPKNESSDAATRDAEDWLQVVRDKVSRLQFGSVQVTVHDGRVTQVESLERTRFPTDRKAAG